MSKIPGYIQWVRSSQNDREFPVLVFSADCDFATSGMVSLTSTEICEVIATMASSEEWAQYDRNAIENRVNRALARSDLRSVELLRIENGRLIYADILSEGGVAFATRTQSLREFVKSGG